VLPLDRDQAIAWIRAHDVGEVIVENISYYRATAVFPELATGQATPPFELLGDQRYYQAPGGKPVYAYRLGAALDQQSLFPGVDAAVRPAPQEGKTAPLAKGVTLTVNGADPSQTLVGPQLGIWVPVGGGWARLRSAGLGVEWSLPSIAGAQLFAGRELSAPGFDWAGLDYMFTGPFSETAYRINVQEAR